MKNFNDYDWHDSIVKSININRNKPGIVDDIHMEIEWTSGDKGVLIFKGVYHANFLLNFGIVADESILTAFVNKEDKDLEDIYVRWKGLIDNITLCSYTIQLNATDSKIKIIASDYIIVIK